MPVFALDESVDWDDLENALEASAEYQSSQRGVILPLFAFAPMTEPANLDQWERNSKADSVSRRGHIFRYSVRR